MDTKGGKWRGVGSGMNWVIMTDMYTLMCIKLMTNKNLLYKKINKIKFKKKKMLKKKESTYQCRGHGLDPWSGKIPHATEQLSLCATTTEPVLWSP